MQNLSSNIARYWSNQNVADLSSANSHTDQLLQYLAPYVVTGKGAAIALGKAISEQNKAVTKSTQALEKQTSESLASIVNNAKLAAEELESLRDTKASIEKTRGKILGENEEEGLLSKAERLIEDSESALTKSQALLVEVEGDDDTEGLKDSIQNVVTEVGLLEDSARTSLVKLESELKELNSLHSKVFGIQDDEGEWNGGLQNEFKSLTTKHKDWFNVAKQDHENLHKKIQSLLPDATSAGLAGAFAAQKTEYKKPIFWLTVAFVVSLLLLLFLGISSLVDIVDGKFTWLSGSWDKVIVRSLMRLPIALPLIWLAVFAATKRSENRRLLEEYSHKETVARSYESFRKQISSLPQDAEAKLATQLLEAAISSLAFNASSTLDGDHKEVYPDVDQIANLARLQNLLPKTMN